jgi:mannose-6-phosphate isomerase-like protein (cupin superfamily)
MRKLKISEGDVEPVRLAGRDLRWIITRETAGAEQMSIAIMRCFPNAVVKPLHAHRDIEEVIYIVEGEGQCWIDGEVLNFTRGDAVFFPANSRHQVRNTADRMLVTASIFSKPTSPDQYVSYPENMFAQFEQ